MRLIKLCSMSALLLASSSVLAFADEKGAGAEAKVRLAVEKALPYLAREGDLWIEKRKCSSCHQTGLLIWGNRLAQSRGFAVDAGRLSGWTQWMIDYQTGPRTDGTENVLPGIAADGDLEGAGQLVLSGALGENDDESSKVLHQAFLTAQQSAGFWKAGGQLPFQKRPVAETDAVSTAWAILAIDALPAADRDARFRALAWLAEADRERGKSVELAAVRLLVAHRFQAAGHTAAKVEALLKLKNADGGWPWLVGEGSDALATGQALYALAEAHANDAAVRQVFEDAWQFLAGSQLADGSWQVMSTKEKSRHKSTGISNYFGSAWSVIGICRSLPESE